EISKLGDAPQHSPIITALDMPWRISVRSENSARTDNVKYLGAYLYCNEEDDSGAWNCHQSSVVKLLNYGSEERDVSLELATIFNLEYNNWGNNKLLDWNRLMNDQEMFLKDDKVTIEVNITVKEVCGIREMLKFDFSVPQSFGSDSVILIVDGKKVHVSKQFVAMHSPVFESMFFKDFEEKGKEEIELKEVSYEGFIELLYVI
ncbi:hypothetical protein PFISCL1PPCAC_21001, partial [Pristionchus fissidentatus]